MVKIWADDGRIAVHPWIQQSGQCFILPSQWSGLTKEDGQPRLESMLANRRLGALIWVTRPHCIAVEEESLRVVSPSRRRWQLIPR